MPMAIWCGSVGKLARAAWQTTVEVYWQVLGRQAVIPDMVAGIPTFGELTNFQTFAVDAFAAPDLSTAHDLKHHPVGTIRHSALSDHRDDVPLCPDRCESTVIGMTLDQVLCNKNTSGAKFSIAMSGDRIASIDFVTLVTRWIKQRSAVQRGGRTVVLNGACFAGEFASRNELIPVTDKRSM